MTYKHTLRLRRDSRVLRFYLWLYRDASVAKVDFCRLFWGIVLSPVVMVAIGLLLALIAPIAWIAEKVDGRKRNRPSVSVDTPSRAGEFFARPAPRRIAKGVLIVCGAIVATALVGAIGWGLYVLISTGAILYALGGIAAFLIVASAIGLLVWIERRGRFDGFERVVSLSYYALKTNTCPKVEVE